MFKKGKILFGIFAMIFTLGASLGSFHIHAQESIEDEGVSVYSLGDEGETILVRGREETVGDYGDVIGYEITSSSGTGYIEYRDNMHHNMIVITTEGFTEGYCMQPYMVGPGTNAYYDYSYVEGIGSSSVFSNMTEAEVNRSRAMYVVATKYACGGYMADPNCVDGTNYHDGGTYGTYIVNENGQERAVKGLMIGGMVYEMSYDEARSLTQVIVHYVGNRGSEYNITDFLGYEHPNETSAAFKHLKAYADNSGVIFDSVFNVPEVSKMFDNYEQTKAYQSIKWYVYNYSTNAWEEYSGAKLGTSYLSQDKKLKLRVEYYSKNMCNKLLVNTDTENVSVKYSYEPFAVSDLGTSHYDYITIYNSSQVPITVTYNKVTSGKENISNQLLGNMNYEIDTFSQTADIEVDAAALLKAGSELKLSVSTGVGATAGDCYDSDAKTFSARMYSSANVQDCLFLASNKDLEMSQSISLAMDITGSMSLLKTSSRQDITKDNPCYNMSGATYNVYAVAGNKDESKSQLVGTFVINEAGTGVVTYSRYNANDVSGDGTNASKNKLTGLPVGWYMVCEEVPPANNSYKLDSQKYYVEITLDNVTKLQQIKSVEEPVADPIPFEVVKQCAEGENVGSATLEGAEFTVWYYKGEYNSLEEIEKSGAVAERKWIFSTETADTTNNATSIIHKDGLLEGSDEPYLSADGNMILPLGTIVVEETKAPEGYMLDNATYSIVNTIDGTVEPISSPYVSPVVSQHGTAKLSVANKIIVEDKPFRGDVTLTKTDKYTGEPMAGIPFVITSKTTGESHIMVTDENGIASTQSSFVLHSENTNGNDQYNQEDSLTPTGIWFFGNMSENSVEEASDDMVDATVDDTAGALPYDTYTLKELPCSANEDYYLSEEITFTINGNGQVCDCGEIENIHKPVIATEVFDVVDNDKTILIGGTVSVIDRVSYDYLEVGKAYILEGIIVNKTTGEQVKSNDIEVTSSVEFVPDTLSGTIDVPFEFELVCCKGDKLVVYEYLYDKETGELVASHEEINCSKQTLTLETVAVKNEIKAPEEDMATERAPKTGDSRNIILAIAVMAVTGISFAVILIKRRRECRG